MSTIAFMTLGITCSASATASDWLRFRGPNGSGICPDAAPLPTEFGPDKNLAWQIELPGPGSSCPIVVGERVFVTCWSGYGLSRDNPGDQANLKRHLVCVNRRTGEVIWNKTIDPFLPEDNYGGMFAEHGYASHTPVSDGERIYCYFGKTGVVAFDMNGEQLWTKSCGTESDPRDWGTASSPILHNNVLIVTAAAESEAMIGFDKTTGEELWRQEASGFSGTWGTPVLMKVDDQRTDLVIGVPYEIWSFNPDTGKLRWHAKGIDSNSFCASLVPGDGVVYGIDGREGGAVAVKVGGEGDVSDSAVVWRSQQSNRIITPVKVDDRIYYFGRGIAYCVDAANGNKAYQARMNGSGAGAPAGGPGGGGFGGGGGRGGAFRSGDYASPVVADGKIYFPARRGDIFVVALGDKFEQLAVNRLSDDEEEDWSSTPAVSDGQLFIRSSKRLYCIANKQETAGKPAVVPLR
ncbi:MAG: PQQ-like beta-propeller repeat protein [Pirellulales bacterium]|nr:PQQ-like beta-propeller repeat protein [Pirellulales bacterium]